MIYSKKTVAIIINTTWNIYNFRLGLIKSLQKEGYRVIAISPYDKYAKELEEMGCKHYHIPMNNKGTNPIEDLKLIYNYYKIFRQLSPDIILGYTIKPNIYGSFAAKILGMPIITNISGLGTVFLSKNKSSKIARSLYKIALKIPKKVFFQNKHDKSMFIKLKLVEETKAFLVPGSGIDTCKFAPIKINNNSNKIKFLFIARLVKDKGLIEYIEAAKMIKSKYKNIELAVLGDFYKNNPTAITKQQMFQWVEIGLINYLGVSDDVKYIIAEYDCIVLPSYREGLSRVLLEAASMEKPIITTNVPGCKDIVEDGVNGFLCSVKNSNDLFNKIECFINLNYNKKILMGKEGRKKVLKEFEETIVINRYLETIKSIL